MHPTFSNRWREFESEPNALALAEAERRAAGTGLLDLTVSNPTRCGLDTPADWTRLLDDPAGRTYDPHPQGLRPARKAIAEYYARRGQAVDPDDLFLTSGTSEAYSHLFKLLANPGDRVLAPRPSYPLLHSLAGLESLQLDAYGLAIGEESRGGMFNARREEWKSCRTSRQDGRPSVSGSEASWSAAARRSWCSP
jgi:aspartate/methionine/tyrosine aminotransferase